MRKATLRGLLAHKLRLGLTVLAITLGVALVAGTFTLTGAMTAGSASPPTTAQPDVIVRGQPLDALAGASPEQAPPRQPLDATTAEEVAGVDGVTAVRGVVEGPVTILTATTADAATGNPATGVSLTDVAGLRPQAELADGRLPSRGHAVLDADTARALDLTIGDHVHVAGADGRDRAFTLSGITRAGGPGTSQPGSVVGFDLATAQQLLDRAGQFDGIQVAAPGTDPTALRERVSAAVGRGGDVDTGAAVQRQQQDQRDRSVRTVNQTMVWFVIVALLIGGFLVANAFSIMIAQRTRELALLRCLGATPAQVRNAVLGEALVIGAAASVLGTLLGPLVATLLAQQFARLGGGFTAATGLGGFLSSISPLAALGSLAVGVLVTVASALLPARKATAVPPLTAMRAESSGPAVERTSRARVVVGLAVAVAGGAVMAVGLTRYAGALVGGGGLLFLVGAAILAVPVTRPLARLLGTPLARLGGLPFRLARANAMRSPRRTASTAAALMIGLAMIVTMTVIAGSQQATAVANARTLGADYQVAAGSQPLGSDPFGTPDGPTVSRALLEELAAHPQVTGVTGRWSLTATLATPAGRDGPAPEIPVDAVHDPAAYQRIAGLRVEAGDMGGGGFAVRDTFADRLGVSPGSRLRVEIPGAAAAGSPVVLPVTGVFHDPDGRASPIVVPLDRAVGALPSSGVPVAYVEVAGGPTPAAAATLESTTSAYPAVTVRDAAAQARFQEQQINQVLYLMYALLGLAVVIGLLGIVNTLALSMVDRVRELGLLRALGMDRSQVRAMIRGEALIIALLGALLGLAVGLLFGWAVASRLMRLAEFAVPAAQLTGLVAAAAVASVAAAILPGRWAARVDVLRAVASD